MATSSNEKKINKKIYKDTVKICTENPTLIKAIEDTRARQQVILKDDILKSPATSAPEAATSGACAPETTACEAPSFEKPGSVDSGSAASFSAVPGSESVGQAKSRVTVTDKRTFKAAMDHPSGKICVLNFASSTTPGGGVEYGCRAQEESLCRISTLGQCISDGKCWAGFYDPHREACDPLNNNDIIYSPDVVIFKEDNDQMALMPQDRWKKVDVLTCAAPKLTKKKIPDQELRELLIERIGRIFEVACHNRVEIFIVGAFGCGAFKNPPNIVAEAFDHVIKKYDGRIKEIEFAVPSFHENDNNSIFTIWFGNNETGLK